MIVSGTANETLQIKSVMYRVDLFGIASDFRHIYFDFKYLKSKSKTFNKLAYVHIGNIGS